MYLSQQFRCFMLSAPSAGSLLELSLPKTTSWQHECVSSQARSALLNTEGDMVTLTPKMVLHYLSTLIYFINNITSDSQSYCKIICQSSVLDLHKHLVWCNMIDLLTVLCEQQRGDLQVSDRRHEHSQPWAGRQSSWREYRNCTKLKLS